MNIKKYYQELEEIEISLNNKDDIYCEYDRNNKKNIRLINPSLLEYIHQEVSKLEKNKCKVNFTFEEEPSEEEKIQIKKDFALFLDIEIYTKRKNIRSSFKEMFLYFSIGIVFLLLYNLKLEEMIIDEIFLIASWVSIWESFYIFIMNIRKELIVIKDYEKIDILIENNSIIS